MSIPASLPHTLLQKMDEGASSLGLIRSVIRDVTAWFGADDAVVVARQPGATEYVPWFPQELETDPLLASAARLPAIAVAVQHGNYAWLSEFSNNALPLPLLRHWGLQSAIVIPVCGGRTFTGAILFLWRARVDTAAFASSDLRLLHTRLTGVIPLCALAHMTANDDHRARIILDAVPQAVLLHEPVRGTVLINRLAADLLSLPYGAVESQTVAAAMARMHDTSGAGNSMEALSASLTEPPTAGGEKHTWQMAGRYFQITSTPLSFDGSAAHLLVLSDVTILFEQQQALETAVRQAEAASEAKSRFLANMSHEIRTPLNGTIGLLRVALSQDDLRDQRDNLGVALESSQQLLRIINEILDLSKVESGRLEIEIRRMSLSLLFTDVVALFGGQASQKGVRLEHSVEAAVDGDILGDSGRLLQILANVVANAIKFTEVGSVTLSARLADVAGPPHYRIEIADTGIGLSTEAQQRLFTRYVQGDASIQRRFGGTGLGLALSRELTTLMGGRIDVESTEGVGSVFWIELPLRRPEPLGDAATPDAQPPTVPNAEQALAGLHILVVEDNPVNRLVARTWLLHLGCRVSEAVDGERALELVARQTFDAVLMDCQMPVMDGFAATRALRARESETGVHLPIVALTANAFDEDRQLCLDAGMDDFLSKPIDEKALVRALTRVCHIAPPHS